MKSPAEKASERPALFRVVEALTVELRELSAALEQAEKQRWEESSGRLAAESLLHSEQERLTGLQADLEQAREERARLATLEEELREVSEELQEARRAVADARHEASRMRAAFNELEARAQTRRQLIETLTAVRDRLEQELEPALADLHLERTRAEQLEKSLEVTREDRRALWADLGRLRTDFAALELERRELDAERATLAQRIDELEGTLRGRDSEARSLGEQLTEARGRLTDLEARAQLTAALETERDRLRDELQSVQRRSEEAQAELRSTLNAERAKLAQRIDGLNVSLRVAELESRTQQTVVLEAERDRLREELQSVKRRSQEAESRLRSSLDAERMTLAQRIDELNVTLFGRDEETRSLGEQLTEARGRLAELESLQQRSQETEVGLRSSLDTERTTLAQRIDELNVLLLGRDEEARSVREQLAEASERLAELESRVQETAALEAERDRLRGELESVRRRSQETEAELRSTLDAEREKKSASERLDALGEAGRVNETRRLGERVPETEAQAAEPEPKAQVLSTTSFSTWIRTLTTFRF